MFLSVGKSVHKLQVCVSLPLFCSGYVFMVVAMVIFSHKCLSSECLTRLPAKVLQVIVVVVESGFRERPSLNTCKQIGHSCLLLMHGHMHINNFFLSRCLHLSGVCPLQDLFERTKQKNEKLCYGY